MAYFQILGTGPSTPITDGTGRNYRRRSSALMQNIATYFLVDVTHDFEEQIDIALSVTAVAVTNASRDAAGGLGTLDRWTDHRLPVCVPTALWAQLVDTYGPFDKLDHVPCEPMQATQVGDLRLTPVPVETSPGDSGRLTFAYHFDTGKKTVTYASDVKHFEDTAEPYFSGNDLLVVDAAGWDKDLPTHRGALNHVHDYVQAGNQRVLFTHLGRSAPPHAQASTLVRRLSFNADVAFDFMKIPLGR